MMTIQPRPLEQMKLIRGGERILDFETREDAGYSFAIRAQILAALPACKQEDLGYQRKIGKYEIYIANTSGSLPLPYGPIPRLVFAWMIHEAAMTRNRKLELGDGLSDFLCKLGVLPATEQWDTYIPVRRQAEGLFLVAVVMCYPGPFDNHISRSRTVCTRIRLLQKGVVGDTSTSNVIPIPIHDPVFCELSGFFKFDDDDDKDISTITIDHNLYNEVIQHHVSIDICALRALSTSSLAIDIYLWINHRLSYLQNETYITWEHLQLQFGAGYMNNKKDRHTFQQAFGRAFKQVQAVMPGLKSKLLHDRLVLLPQ